MFTTEEHKQASYLTAITQAGLLTEDGCELSLQSWWNSNFFLPFLVSAPTSDNQYSGELRDTISQKPTAQTGGKTILYLRYVFFFSFLNLFCYPMSHMLSSKYRITSKYLIPITLYLPLPPLFMPNRFKTVTSYVIRVSVFYSHDSTLAIDSDMNSWKDYDVDQVSQKKRLNTRLPQSVRPTKQTVGLHATKQNNLITTPLTASSFTFIIFSQ